MKRLNAVAHEPVLRVAVVSQEDVIAHPHFEQITEDEEGVKAARCQVLLECGRRGRVSGLQMQVRDEVDPPPVGRPLDRGPGIQMATAFSMTTSLTGTSSWKPLRPVLTARMASTISVPPTTLPKTA